MRLGGEVCDTLRMGKGVMLGAAVIAPVLRAVVSKPVVVPLLSSPDPRELESHVLAPG